MSGRGAGEPSEAARAQSPEVLLDRSGMWERVLGFPDQIRAACKLAAEGPDLLAALSGARPPRVYVVGMGGSAIGGDFVRACAEADGVVPVEVVRGYDLPAPASRGDLAFFVSYSGNTEETLSAWEEAARRGLARAAVTSGGELARRAAGEHVPLLKIPSGSPPRAALGWTSVPILRALARAGLVRAGDEDIEEAAAACAEAIAEHGPERKGGPLREWARAAAEGWPVIYAPRARLYAAAVRWATQINENGKAFAHVALLPEQNHNEIVAWEHPSEPRRLAEVAMLVDERTHPRVRLRMELLAEQIREAGGGCMRFEPAGQSLPARLYSLAAMGDVASLYVAEARGVDPTPVASIERLKEELRAAGAVRPAE